MTDFSEVAATLLVKQTTCKTEKETNEILAGLIKNHQRVRVVSFVNAHAVLRAQNDIEFRKALLASDVLFRDGSGMEMLMRQLDLDPGLNLNGTDLIPRIIGQTQNTQKIALFGTATPRINLAAEHIRGMGFEDVLWADGFRPDAEYVSLLRRNTPSLVILGMGMPKQERVATLIARDIYLRERDMLVINGGAILDFLSGEVPRAPRWMCDLGIEWLFRLLREPRRMLPRFRDSIVFALHVHFSNARLRKALDKARSTMKKQLNLHP